MNTQRNDQKTARPAEPVELDAADLRAVAGGCGSEPLPPGLPKDRF